MATCYSPFFTSGFLSGTNKIASSSTSQESPRRGSLPTLKLHYSDQDDDVQGYRGLERASYLSLDSADAPSGAASGNLHGHENVPSWLIPPTVDEHCEGIRRKGVTPRQSRESLRVLPSPKLMPVVKPPSRPPQANAHASSSSLRRAHRPSDSDGIITSSTLRSASPDTPARPRTISLSSADQSSANRATLLASTLAKLEGLTTHSFFDDDDDDDDSDESFVEPEDVVLPASPSDPRPRSSYFALSSSNAASPSKARGVLNAWTLSSFVDLSGDSSPKEDDRWNWRSFIEIGVM